MSNVWKRTVYLDKSYPGILQVEKKKEVRLYDTLDWYNVQGVGGTGGHRNDVGGSWRNCTRWEDSDQLCSRLTEDTERPKEKVCLLGIFICNTDKAYSFIWQANSFFCNFPVLDVETKNSLFNTYCSSHYGSELWNLTIIISRIIALHKGNVYEDFGRFHTIRAN